MENRATLCKYCGQEFSKSPREDGWVWTHHGWTCGFCVNSKGLKKAKEFFDVDAFVRNNGKYSD
jgi:hypothetical protein